MGRLANTSALRAEAADSAHEGAAGYQVIARMGYAARGSVYLMLGFTAVSVALGARRHSANLTTVIGELLHHPIGSAVVLVISAGMLAFALWRLAQGLLDADGLGGRPSALFRRVAYALSSLMYFGIAFIAVAMLFRPDVASGRSPRRWAAWLLDLPLGSAVLASIGIGFLAVGVAVAVRAYREPFKKQIAAAAPTRRWIAVIGTLGEAVRSVLFCLVGYFLVLAAVRVDTHDVKDLGDTLDALQQMRFGMLLYSLVAIGLILFGLFEVILALYRRVGGRNPLPIAGK